MGTTSPSKFFSSPAMILSSVDFPEPFRPSTPIFAPGKKLSEMFLRIWRFGGTVLPTRRRVYTYCGMGFGMRKADSLAQLEQGEAAFSENPEISRVGSPIASAHAGRYCCRCRPGPRHTVGGRGAGGNSSSGEMHIQMLPCKPR